MPNTSPMPFWQLIFQIIVKAQFQKETPCYNFLTYAIVEITFLVQTCIYRRFRTKKEERQRSAIERCRFFYPLLKTHEGIKEIEKITQQKNL